MPLFKMGANDFGEGLEAIAEDGNPAGLAMVLKTKKVLRPAVFSICRMELHNRHLLAPE